MYRGEFALFAGSQLLRPWLPNDLVVSAGHLVLQALANKDPTYGLSVMYVEFENVADAETAASIPTIDPEDLDYYSNLSSSPSRDFLRILLTEDPATFMVDGYATILPETMPNGVIIYGSTGDATEGVNGKAFDAASFSKIAGLAIGAAPSVSDRTQDILYARAYYSEETQWLVQDNIQLRVSYRIRFTDI